MHEYRSTFRGCGGCHARSIYKRLTSLENFNVTSKLSTWIYGIALNKSKEFLRKKQDKNVRDI